MRILIISPHFHPYFNPRASRWTALAQYWGKKGYEVHVICSHGPFPEQKEAIPNVQTHRAGYNSLKEILYVSRKQGPRRGVPGSGKLREGGKNWTTRLLFLFNKYFLQQIYWPDDAFIWYFPAKGKALQLLREQAFDILISVAPPFTAHWLGLYLKRHFPGMRWIADTGDPFAFQPDHPFNNTFFYGKKNRQAESDVLRRADAFVVTNPGAQKLYQEHFPSLSDKVVVIPPLYSAADEPMPAQSTDTGHLDLGYFGTFFKNIREASPLLDFFAWLLQQHDQLDKLPRLHLFGDIFEPFQQQIRKLPEKVQAQLQVHGLVSKKEAAERMQQMDFLLNLGNTTSFQLPSKTVDYLAAGRPILNLQQSAQDASRIFFDNQPHILHVPLQHLSDQQEAVLTFLREMKGWKMEEERRKELSRPYELRSIAAQLEDLWRKDQAV